MIVEIEFTKRFKKNINDYLYRFFPGYRIFQNPTQCPFGKVNITIFNKNESGPKRAIDVRDYSY